MEWGVGGFACALCRVSLVSRNKGGESITYAAKVVFGTI
jgi:hypothetical protein